MHVSRFLSKIQTFFFIQFQPRGKFLLYQKSRHSARGMYLVGMLSTSIPRVNRETFKLEPTVRQLAYGKLTAKRTIATIPPRINIR
jgi:hypothetical protein